jgi:WD40 repeat protein
VKNAPGNRLISGCYDGSIKIWDRKNGECIKTINDHTKVVREIFINSNDKLVTNSLDQTIRCFDLNSFDCLWKIDADARSCDLLSNNKLIFCDDHIKIQVWETNTCTCLKTIEYNAWRVKGISDELIATGSFQNEIIIWNIESGTCLKTLQRNSSDGYIAIIQSLESFIKISDEQIASGLDKNTIKIWNINSGQCLKIINTLSICSLKKLSDKKIISCSSDRIQVWDIETGECLKLIETDCYNFDF